MKTMSWVRGVVLVGAVLVMAKPAMSEPKFGGLDGVNDADMETDYNVVGTYQIVGSGPDGKQYTGSCGISKIGGEMYKGTWTIGSSNFAGICFRDDQVLSCGWANKHDLGVMAYLVKDDNSLDGVWFEENHTKLGKEFLVGGNNNLLGTYTIKSGETPEGGKYNGTVNISLVSGVYNLNWTVGKHNFKGLGLRSGDVLSAGFNDSGSFGVLQYRIKKGGKFLTGQWAQTGLSTPGPGVETLSRSL